MQTARRKRRRANYLLRQIVAGLVVLAVIVVAIVVVAGGGGSRSRAPRQVESMFQDDSQLVYGTTAQVTRALQTLKILGVDRIRVTLKWQDVAPAADDLRVPTDFNPSIPTAPGYNWSYYDRIDLLASHYGIALDFDITGPGPLWAAEANAHDAALAESFHLTPDAFNHVAHNFGLSATAFEQFVEAAGRRYSGDTLIRVSRIAGQTRLPRVSFWSVWNEPNQPGWLAPQFQLENGVWQQWAPVLYREYVEAAVRALDLTGHAKDSLLIGELAPEGCVPGSVGGFCAIYPKIDQPLPPIPFIQTLYCLDGQNHPLQGTAASAAECPTSGSRADFVRANPGLFQATAFGHHPYSFTLPPQTELGEPDFVPLADLSRLETELDAVFTVYGVHRKLPLYLDEYGYETNPPNPTNKGMPLGVQSTYLNQAQHMVWGDKRVIGLSQFLLIDSPPSGPGTAGYQGTFQTGLEFLDGTRKPSFAAYALPVALPLGGVAQGHNVRLWAMLRAAPNHTTQHAVVQWGPPRGSFETIERVTTHNPVGVFTTNVRVPGSGSVRVQWVSSGGVVYDSRAVPVTVPAAA